MMRFILAFIFLCFPLLAIAQSFNPIVKDVNQQLLPSPFKVYFNGEVVINHPQTGFTELNLPTNNDYTQAPGCYIACYSHDKENAVYNVSADIYVVGQVRVPGEYANGICIPSGFAGKDISGMKQFKAICNTKIATCKDCWAGGDTGGWFGI